jgi:two-component system LytT family response regulator
VHEAHRYGKSYDLVMDNKDVVRVSRYGKSYDLVMDNKDVVRVSRGYMDRLRDITF